MIDNTGTISAESKRILSCFDETDENDFRYSQYSTLRSVIFYDIEPDEYVCHADSGFVYGEGGVRIRVDEGDNLKITFTKNFTPSYTLCSQVYTYICGSTSSSKWSYKIQYL